MHWKTVWAAEPDFVAIVFLKDSCGCPRLTLVAYIRRTGLSSSAEFTPHSYYVQGTQEVLYWWGNKMGGFWHIIGMKIVAVALQTVSGFVFSGWLFLKPFLSHNLSGKIFLPAYNHLIATAILKEFHLAMVVFCHFLTFFFPFVLLLCFDSSCDYVLWLQDGLLQSLENFLNASLWAVSNKLPPFY